MKHIYRTTIGILLISMVGFPLIETSSIINPLVTTIKRHKIVAFSALLTGSIVWLVVYPWWKRKRLEKTTLNNFANNNFFMNSTQTPLINHCINTIDFEKNRKFVPKNIPDDLTDNVHIGKEDTGIQFDKKTLMIYLRRFFILLQNYPILKTEEGENQQLLLTNMLKKGLNNNKLYEEDAQKLNKLESFQSELIREFIEEVHSLK